MESKAEIWLEHEAGCRICRGDSDSEKRCKVGQAMYEEMLDERRNK